LKLVKKLNEVQEKLAHKQKVEALAKQLATKANFKEKDITAEFDANDDEDVVF